MAHDLLAATPPFVSHAERARHAPRVHKPYYDIIVARTPAAHSLRAPPRLRDPPSPPTRAPESFAIVSHRNHEYFLKYRDDAETRLRESLSELGTPSLANASQSTALSQSTPCLVATGGYPCWGYPCCCASVSCVGC